MDEIEAANKKSLDEFTRDYLPPSDQWNTWTHPATGDQYAITLLTSTGLSDADFNACFQLIKLTSADDYKKSKTGWKPTAKQKEMKLLDLKYFLIKRDNEVEGFASFMPTHEDGHPVIYCYEIHLASAVRGTGLGRNLMELLERIGSQIPGTAKMMLTCFTCNERGVQFYIKLGYSKDEYSPPPQILRNGTQVESKYIILSKVIS